MIWQGSEAVALSGTGTPQDSKRPEPAEKQTWLVPMSPRQDYGTSQPAEIVPERSAKLPYVNWQSLTFEGNQAGSGCARLALPKLLPPSSYTQSDGGPK